MKNRKDQNNALLIALRWQKLQNVSRLLQISRIDIHAVNAKGQTALILASMFGNVDIVGYLLSHGVDKNHADGDGKTALVHAQEKFIAAKSTTQKGKYREIIGLLGGEIEVSLVPNRSQLDKRARDYAFGRL